MDPSVEHTWQCLQTKLAEEVVQQDLCSWSVENERMGRIKHVGGLDISFIKRSAPGESVGERAVAALMVLAFPELSPVYQDLIEIHLNIPYCPGFLGFRECPPYIQLLERAKQGGIMPQVLLVDGYGVLHPRRLGSASQLGVLTGVPTIGVAKTLLHVGGLERAEVLRAIRAQQAQHACGQHSRQPGDHAGRCKEVRLRAAAASTVELGGRSTEYKAPDGAAVGWPHLSPPGAGIPAAAPPPCPMSWPDSSPVAGTVGAETREQGTQQLACAPTRQAAGEGARPPPPATTTPLAVPPPGQAFAGPAAERGRGRVEGQAAVVYELRVEGGEVLGAAVCPPGATRPIYVSVGHLVSLESAVAITLACCKHRIPEPIRQADLRSRERVRQILAAEEGERAACREGVGAAKHCLG